jgi:hypothetical protein
MKIDPKAAKRPEGGPGDKRPKQALQEAFQPNEPSSDTEDEVGGRDRRYNPNSGRWEYPGYWHYGPYLWLCDGLVYEGWHWHPNRWSPGAWDQDDC